MEELYDGNVPSLLSSWLAWGYKVCGNEEAYQRSIARIREIQLENPDPYDPGLIYMMALESDADGFMKSFEQVVEE